VLSDPPQAAGRRDPKTIGIKVDLHIRTRMVITPHTSEMATLLGIPRRAVMADLLGSAREAACRLQAGVALKGATTYIVSPQGEAWFFDEGNVGLATSGSGDALAGIIVGLPARGATPLKAAMWGVYLHGEAGNRLSHIHGHVGFLARELLDAIPRGRPRPGLRAAPVKARYETCKRNPAGGQPSGVPPGSRLAQGRTLMEKIA
jgi:NAD(P)H-hydrate repair Nnr-like enzyme with NAD(P)H-hydrate dehydratase domain